MKSKVILFCVLLFCSKIVGSIPHSEDHVRQRVNPLSNWQVNQNARNAQYLDTDFIQTRNANIQPEKTQDFYPNQGRRHNYDSNVYNRNPASSLSGEDLLVSYDPPADGLRLDSYPSRVESYPSRTSQVGFDNEQYRNQNWRPQNQYIKPVPRAVLIPDDERPLMSTVQEPYRGPVQYPQPKYVPSTNRGFYQPGRTYLTREQIQYPLTGDREYVANSAPRFGSSGPLSYENYGEDQVAASEIKARPAGGRRYMQRIAHPSGIIYNEAPAVIATDTLTDQSENIEFAENYRSRSVLSNSAPITNQGVRSPLISEPDNNSDSISSNLAHINTKKEAPVINSKILSEKPLVRRYANNYRSDSGWSNIVGDDSANGALVGNEPVEVKSGTYEANYGPREPVPINVNSGAPSGPSDTVLVNSGSNKHEESHVAHHGSSSPSPTNTNPKQNVYPTISSEGITEYNLSSFVAKPEIQDILARTNKRYVVVHSNGTVEFLDTIDLGSPQNSKLRLVHHKRKNIYGSDSDGALTQQSPEYLPKNVAKTPLSGGEYPLPTNNQPVDAGEYDSNLSPPWKNLQAYHSNLKPWPQPEKQPADNKNYKLLPSSSTSNEYQSTHNDNLKHLPQGVNQPRDDDDSKTLTPHVNQSAGDINSKPLPQDGNKPADQKNQSADDDNLKSLTSKEDQPAHDYNSKLDQTKDENNITPLLPNARQPAHVKKPKNLYVKHPANDNNSEPLPAKENQPHDDKIFDPYRRHPAHHHKSKQSHVNQPYIHNSNPSSPGESQPANDSNSWPSNEDQSGGETDSTSLLPHKKHPVHSYKPKSRHSHDKPADDNPSSPNENSPENNHNSKPLPSNKHQSGDETDSISLPSHKNQPSHHYKPKSRHSLNQSADNNSSTTPKLLTYPKNQPGGDKNSNPSSSNENALENDDNSKPLPSNKHQSGDETDSTSLPSHKKQPSHHYKPKSRHSHNQSADDNQLTTPKLLTYPNNQPGGDKNSNPSSPNENAPENNDNSKPLPSNEHQWVDETDSTSMPSHKKQPSLHYKPISRHSHNQPADNNPSTTPKLLTYPKNQPGGDKNSNPSSPNENAPENNDNSKPLPSNKHQSGDETDSTSLPSHKKQPSHHYKPKSRHLHNQSADDNQLTTPKLLIYPNNQPGGNKNSNPSSPNENEPENNDNSKPLPSNKHQSGDETDSTSLPSHKKHPVHSYKPKSRHSHYQPADDNPSSPNENAPENSHISKPLPSNKHQLGDGSDSTSLPLHKNQPSHRYKPKSINSLNQSADNNSSTTPKLLNYPKNQPGGDKNSNPSSPNENAPENNDNSEPLALNKHQSGDETDSPSFPSHKNQPSHHYKPKSRHSLNQSADNNSSTTPKLLTYPKNQPGSDKNSNPSSPNENAPENNDNSKPLPSNKHQSGDETDLTSMPSHKIQPSLHYKPKSRHSHNQPADDNPSTSPKLLTYHENQPGDDKNSNSSSPNENAPENNDNSKPFVSNKHQSGDETDSTSLPLHKKQPSYHYKPKSRHSLNQSADNNSSTTPKLLTYPKIQSGGDKNSNPSSPNENAPENNDNSKPLPSNKHQSGDETDSTSLPSHKKQPSHHYQPKSRHSLNQSADNNSSTTPKLLTYPKNQPGGDKNSNPSSPNENAPENNDNSKPLPSNKHQSVDETDSTSLPSHKKQPLHHYKPKSRHSHNQTADDNPSTSPKNQPGDDKNSNPLSPNANAQENNDNSKPLSSNEHQTGNETDATSLPSHKKQPHYYKPKSRHSHETDDNNSTTSSIPLLNYPEKQAGDYDNWRRWVASSPSEDQTDDNTSKPLSSNENQAGDGYDSELLGANKRQQAHHNKSKHSYVNQPANDDEEQPGDDNDSESLPAHATQPANTTKSKPSHASQPGNDNNSNPSSPDENQPEEDKKSKPLRSNENQPTDDLKTIPTSAGASKNDDKSNSTTVSPTEPNHTTAPKPQVIKTHKRKHIHRTSTTNSPVVSTTPCPDDTSEDQINTLSPMEQTTDNVRDVPPVATTTTKTSPVETPGKSDNEANNKQDVAQDHIGQKYSNTTVSPSTSTSPTDNISDDKTKGTKEKENTQSKDKTDVDQVKNREKNSQTAVYNSCELFSINTDVPAESDDYSSVTASRSVQNDVDTGDASGDNSLELEQSETDVIITVSSSTANDSEDEIMTINIEVSESTDDADSSITDKSLVVTIDKNDGSDDDSKTPKPEDCKKDLNNDGRAKNVEIDVSNLKGKPTMWIRTTNQDFVDKLTAKNDTEFDLIYFFHIDNQPAIEREKTTTVHCNGTVVTEIIEMTYANKDDLTPTIVKTTKILDLEDYKGDEV